MSLDKYKYRIEPGAPILGLGLNPELAPLNVQAIRHQLSFAESSCIKTQKRAAVLLLERLKQYYQVIGYTGPKVVGSNVELGTAYGGWIVEQGEQPRRSVFHTTNSCHWVDPEVLFRSTRFACAEFSLRLASWEFEYEVPEASELLREARLSAYNALSSHSLTGVLWGSKRGRWGTKGFCIHLANVIAAVEIAQCVPGIHFAEFIPMQLAV